MKTFGQRIHEARKAKGLTLAAIAKAIKSQKGYISGIEHGKTSPPSPKLISALCRKLDLPVDEMATLAHWEKRPKDVTHAAMIALVEAESMERRIAASQKEAV